MTTITTIDSVEELQRQLQTLQFRQMGLLPLPNVELARNRVIDEEALGDHLKLEAARRVLAERLRQHREYDELGVQIGKLSERLAAAESRVRIERATAADEALAAAKSEYQQSQLQCGRAFRRYLNAARRSGNTPGAAQSRPDLNLHLPAITPISWIGTTGQAMSQAMMPFEQQEG